MAARVSIDLDELALLRAEAHGFSFLPHQPVSSLLAGRHDSRLRGRGLAFDELRAYHPGDDVRTIDWRATARLRTTYVRTYTEERERPVLLLVDQRAPMFFGSRRATKSVVAAELAALAAWRTLSVGDRVGGLVFDDAEVVEVRPHKSRSRALHLLHEVARKNAALAVRHGAPAWPADAPHSHVTLDRVLDAAARLARHDHLVVLISDLTDAGEGVRRRVAAIQRRNDLLVVPVFDPLGATITARPGMVAAHRDPATGREDRVRVPTGAAFEDAYRAEFASLVDEWASLFRALRVPLLPVSTAESVADQLRRLFGAVPR